MVEYWRSKCLESLTDDGGILDVKLFGDAYQQYAAWSIYGRNPEKRTGTFNKFFQDAYLENAYTRTIALCGGLDSLWRQN